MEGTRGICGRRLFLPRSLSRVSPMQKPPGTGKEAFPEEKGGRKDFPLPGGARLVSPTLLALQHPLQVWDVPQI